MEYLAAFKCIGWDVDETLIGSHHAEEIAAYIRANPLGQQHHIVTLRSHGMQHRVFRDLEAYGLNSTHFVSLANCPDHV